MTTVNPTGNLSPITSAEINAHTEQALVELIYVGVANDIIGSALGTLQSALAATQSVLNILQALQSMHNEVSVAGKSTFNFDFLTGGSAAHASPGGSLNITFYSQVYQHAASAFFGQAIDPHFLFSANDSRFPPFASALISLRTQLGKEISVIARQTPASTINNPQNLVNALRKVFNELPSTSNYTSIQTWAIDSYNQHGAAGVSNAGSIQNDLTSAITAAQSLNDTQKESVRAFLFVFQQYYQSASAILTSMNQIMTQIAQKISQ
jgi:hypothetical protein